MRHRTPHLANPVRLAPRLRPGNGAEPRIGSAVVTPTLARVCRPDWRLAAAAFALTLIATVGLSL